ncbi:MAG: flagellar biosynthesis protein FlgD [Helicobacteraceae bacterium]|jgi:flagellar basal-body rod modification protein FlgD|nr:flagellar biosynthesis protein FlgD [Helicobacteraceae bacterium]
MATEAIDFMGGKTNSTITYNPNSTLDKDAFLKLLLVQLQYQDPTSPMDTDKMLAQTADMAVIESQANIQKAMENMVGQFRLTSAYQLIGAVGKLADTGLNAVQFAESGDQYKDYLFYEENFENGLFIVTDSNGVQIRADVIPSGEAGLQEFSWDGKNSAGEAVGAGVYAIRAEYTGSASGKKYVSRLGVYPIESVVLNESVPKLFLGGEYYTLDQIVSIKERL